MRTPTLLLLLLASTALAQTPILVKDINPGSANGFPDNNDVLVFRHTRSSLLTPICQSLPGTSQPY
jgi:hypothetical protein